MLHLNNEHIYLERRVVEYCPFVYPRGRLELVVGVDLRPQTQNLHRTGESVLRLAADILLYKYCNSTNIHIGKLCLIPYSQRPLLVN